MLQKVTGLLGDKLEETHLYHATLPAVIVHSRADMDKHRLNGYQEEYIPREYPKAINIGLDKDGNIVQRTARNEAEEAAIHASLAPKLEDPEAPEDVQAKEEMQEGAE